MKSFVRRFYFSLLFSFLRRALYNLHLIKWGNVAWLEEKDDSQCSSGDLIKNGTHTLTYLNA